ncbi:autotransporter outer membrane beta-barrel domain-containing protein [Acidaminococcus intestini]|uniref:autotransporter outer membrane beta-barrel domain-containing protein n=1 Tax=Acidaminococcus intestini TaxID=187327 RepID=UPI0024302CB0|nr:autotransporter outer membrane beta-barrel domain-containing protein [Acidaminococcus intestini]
MLFKRKHGFHFADGRVVVVDGDAVVKRDEHLIGIGVIVADLAEDLADDERPDRLGAVLTKEYDKETKNPKRFYVKASVQHDFLGGRSQHLQQNGMSYYDSNDFRDTWYTVGIGTNVHSDDKYAFYFDAEKNFGADFKSKYRVKVGLRYEF